MDALPVVSAGLKRALTPAGSPLTAKATGYHTANGRVADNVEKPVPIKLRAATRLRARIVSAADGKPAVYSVDALPTDIVNLSADRAALRGSLYRVLSERGPAVDHGEAGR